MDERFTETQLMWLRTMLRTDDDSWQLRERDIEDYQEYYIDARDLVAREWFTYSFNGATHIFMLNRRGMTRRQFTEWRRAVRACWFGGKIGI